MEVPIAADLNDTYSQPGLPSDPAIAMDRTGPPDYAITAITGFTSLILLIASVFVIYARNYEPVKNKQVHILLPSVYSGIIFILSSLVVNNHYTRDADSFWGLCVFWAFWVNLVLGLGPWLSCLVIRPFRLLYTFKYRKAVTPKRAFFMLSIMNIPYLIYAVFAQAFNGWVYKEDKRICQSAEVGWTAGILTIIVVYILTYLIVSILLYKVKSNSKFADYLEHYYYEFPIIRLGIIIAILLAVANLIIWAIKQAYEVSNDVRVWGRFFQTLTGVFAVSFFFFVPMSKPLWKWLFSRDAYLERYRDSMTHARRSAAASAVESAVASGAAQCMQETPREMSVQNNLSSPDIEDDVNMTSDSSRDMSDV